MNHCAADTSVRSAYRPWQTPTRLRPVLSRVGCLLLLAATYLPSEEAPQGVKEAFPAIRGIVLDRSYLAAGEMAEGTVLLDVPAKAPKGLRLSIRLIRSEEVTDQPIKRELAPRAQGCGRSFARSVGMVRSPGGPPDSQAGTTELLLRRTVTRETSEISFEVPSGKTLFGTVRVWAGLSTGDRPGELLAEATSEEIRIGFRKRLDLGGEWTVTAVKVLDGDVPWRPRDWKAPATPETINLPGALPFDNGFRGWVTVKREITWKKEGGLQPRAIRLDGVLDSAKVRVLGAEVGETAPVGDVAVLTHWVEFHCPYKGEENEQKRMLLIAAGQELPVVMPLPRALPAEGKAEIEMMLRGTSGGLFGLGKPTYGVHNALQLELLPAAWIKGVSFDTEKPGEKRRFKFAVTVMNETGKPFRGKIRGVYGSYTGDRPYSGPCLPYATEDLDLTLPPGESTVEVVREETPRFDTCRATFLLRGRGNAVLDLAQQDFHTVVVEIRDRRDLYLNNERFFYKAQGSHAGEASPRFQLHVMGANGFRGHQHLPSRLVPTLSSEAECINDRYKDGLLTSAGSALLASCERCVFWNPKDTSNIQKAVKSIIRRMGACPGIVEWEATNELYGEPEEARIAILEAFHKYDPYHRPVLATKGSGEWEAEAREGRVAGVDIVGCQYLLSKEALDSALAAITEQPLMSTEVNWNDANLYNENRMYDAWLDKGVCGSLLFDYSGGALQQPVPTVPPGIRDSNYPGYIYREPMRALYQDTASTAAKQPDGRVLLTVGNRMPYPLRRPVLRVRSVGRFPLRDLAPGEAATVLIPPELSPPERGRVVAMIGYSTHGGLEHFELQTPLVTAAPKGGAK